MNDDKLAELDSIIFGKNKQQDDNGLPQKMSQLDKIIAANPPLTTPQPKQPKKPQTGTADNIIPDNEQGWISATGTAVARGAIGIGEMGFGAAAGLDRLVDRYINAEPENDPDNWDLKQWAHSIKNEITSAKNKAFKPATSGAKGMWASGVESFVTSAGIKVPAYILATLTAPVTGLATVGAAGAGMLGLIATSPVFGLQQYDEAVDRYVKEFTARGIDPEKARNMAELPALMEGSYEVLSESISDLIEGKLIEPGIAKGRVAAAGSTLRMMLKEGVWKEGVKRGVGTFAAEQVGETLNSLAQLATQEVYGKDKKLSDVLQDDKFWKNMEQQFGQIAVSSLLFGGLVTGGHVYLNNRVANKLENPVAKKADRIEAANIVTKDIAKESEALAKVWQRTSMAAIERDEAISLDDPIDKLGVEDPASASGRLARAIVGEKPLPTQEPTPPTDEGPTNEDEIGKYYPDEVLAAMASGEKEPNINEVDDILRGKGFSDENIDYIKNKVKSLGSIDKVKAFYGDDTVGKYALIYARNTFSKQKVPGDRRGAEIPVGEERRTGERRSGEKLTEDMSPDELRTALLTDNLTLIANRRAYDEADKKAVQVYIDGDSLKWFNDNMGHKAGGDEMLKRIAKALHEETGEAYRVSGDEFMTQGSSPEEIEAAVKRAKEKLAKEEITVTLPNGKTITKQGIEITYGLGTTEERADAKMKAEKVRREKAGKRAARGEIPGGVTITEGEAGHDKKVSEVLSGKNTETPEGIKDETWNSPDALAKEISSLRTQITEAGDNHEVTAPMERRIEVLDARKEYVTENPVETAVDVTQKETDTGTPPPTNTGGPGIADIGGKPGGKGTFELGNPKEATHEERLQNIREGKTTEMPDDLVPKIKDLYVDISGGDINDDEMDIPTADNWNSFEGMQSVKNTAESMNEDLDYYVNELASEDNPMDKKEEASLRERIKQLKDIATARMNYILSAKPPGTGEKVTKEGDNVKETPKENPEKGQEEEAGKAGKENPTTVDDEINNTSIDDLGAMFDESGTKPGSAAETPTQVPTSTGSTTGGPRTTTTTPSPKAKTAGDIIGEAAKAGVAGVDEAMKGLVELFGGGSLKSFPAGFNQETYAKAKPHFEAALAKFREAGRSLKEFVAFIKDQFGAGIKPYLMQFFKDIQAKQGGEGENVNVTQPETESPAKGETPKGKGKKGKKAEKAGGKVGGLRRDMQDAIIQRKKIKDKNKPVEAIIRKASGIIRKIKFKTEASFGLPRIAEYIDGNLLKYTAWAGNEYGGSRSKYARFSLREAIDRMWEQDPDKVIEDANEFIEVHTTIHNAFVGALTLDDALREVFPLFIKGDAKDLPAELKSVDAFRAAILSGELIHAQHDYLTDFALKLYRDFNLGKIGALPYSILAKMVRSEETQFDDTKNKDYKRKKIKVTEIETDGRGRDNKDIDTEKLKNDFGFWGIDYGRWAEGPHRQASLNLTYDGFTDLMDILGITKPLKKVFSLPGAARGLRERKGEEGPGELSIVYGGMARGGKASAAYYPAYKAIGITKENGDGSLAHEWSHALNDLAPTILPYIEELQSQLRYYYNLDNAQDIVERMVRNSSSRMMGETGATFGSIRKHLTDEFDAYFKRETDYFNDAKALDGRQGGICGQKLPQGTAYWANDHELWARAFEAWVSDNLEEEGRSNEYLVRREFVEDGGGGLLFNHENEAYPKGGDRQRINETLRYFFDNVVWDLTGEHYMKEGYETIGEKNRREAQKILDEVLAKGEELFNEIYASNPSKDGLFWYAYKNTARGTSMQPDGFYGYDDSFNLEEGHPEKGTGEGAIAYPERVSIENTRNFGLAPIEHNEDGTKVYTGGENDTGGNNGQGEMGKDETGNGSSSGKTGNTGKGRKGGRRGDGTTAVAGNENDTGGEQGNGTEEGEGDSVSQDIPIPIGGAGADTTSGDLSISAAKPKDYELTRDDDPAGKSLARRFADNISAIDMLHTLESENRLATKEEQKVLAKYSGWGGMKEALGDNPSEGWKIQTNKLKETLTEDELKSLRRGGANDTYNTPHGLGNAIFSVLEHMGFMGGRVLDSSTGTGNLFGLMPTNMRNKSTLVGVEKDILSARMAKQLYQNARIHETPYQSAPLVSDSFDLVVSNIPFDIYRAPIDAEHNETKLATQDYFVKKALDMVRPGGVVAVVASDRILTTNTSKFLDAMNMNGELIGAFKLPASVFGDSQEPVSSDLVFIRKKGPNLPNANTSEFESLTNLSDESFLSWSPYFKEHPEHVLGTVVPSGGVATVEGDADEALSKIPSLARKAFIGGEYKDNSGAAVINPLDNIRKPGDLSPGGMYVAKNGLFYRDGEQVEMGVEDRKKMHSILGIRDSIRKLIREAYGDDSYGTSEEVRKELNEKYDAFVKEHGYLNAEDNVKAFGMDTDAPLILSLEQWDSIGNKFIGKGKLLTETISTSTSEPLYAANAEEAMYNSLAYRGRIDIPYMSSLVGLGRKELIEQLGDLIYDDPQKGWVSADEYLSGHIGRKLRVAEKIAAGDERFKRNVDALKKALPEKVPSKDIKTRLGAPWIEEQHVKDFVDEVVPVLGDGLKIHYNKFSARWETSWEIYGAKNNAELKRMINERKNGRASTVEWGAVRDVTDADGNVRAIGKNFYDLLNYALNGGLPKVASKHIPDALPAYAANLSEEERASITTNELLTDMAMKKLDKIKRSFSQWIMSDAKRAGEVETKFNEVLSGFSNRKWNGEHLPFTGQVPDSIIKLDPHQAAAVWRFITDGTEYLGHEVGTGKTFTMASSIMEAKRLGLMKKPILAVTADTYEQIADHFLELYPGANLYKVDFTGKTEKERNQIYENITTGDWDAIIAKHGQLDKFPVDVETQANLLRKELAKKRAALNNASSQKYQKSALREADEIEGQINELLGQENLPPHTMESMGIDGIVVDEAHEFKNLKFKTRYSNVKGFGSSSSQRAGDLYLKVQSLLSRYGRNVLFGSGTPVSNSIAELYSIQQYLQQEVLDERMLNSFDMWVNTFGNITSEAEPAPQGGGFKMVDKLSSYKNLPELLQTVNSVLDIVRTKDTNIKLPGIKGGEKTAIHVPANKYVSAFRELLIQRAMNIKNLGANAMYGGKRDIVLSLITAGRKAALDVRLINPELPDSPDTKVNHSIEKIMEVYNSKPEKSDGTIEDKPVQFVFLDMGVPSKTNKGFNVYEDIKAKLISKGIPEGEIIFAQDFKKNKKLLSAKARAGDARIVIGSTKVLGVGINAQDRIAATHNIDIDWNYANYEQRLGRMVRQGNLLKEVQIFDYGTKESLDMFLWSKVYDKKAIMDQVLYSSDSSLREFIDESAEASSAGDMLMALANDPLQAEAVELKSSIRELDNQQLEWQYNKNIANEKVDEIPGQLQRLDVDEKRYTRGLELLRKGKGTVVDGEVLDLKKDAAAIAEALHENLGMQNDSSLPLVDYEETTEDVVVLDKDGNPIVDKKKQKEGILAPATFKTKKQKIRTEGDHVGNLSITHTYGSLTTSGRDEFGIRANNGLRTYVDMGEMSISAFPSISRTLSDGIKRYQKLLDAIPDNRERYQKDLAQAKETLKESEFPQLKELKEKLDRFDEVSDQLVENLKRQEEERAANPQTTDFLQYFPEPTPPAEQRGDTPENSPLFSRDKSRKTKTLGKKMVAWKINEVVKHLSLENAPPVVAAQAETDLPSHVLADIVKENAMGEVAAVYDHKTGNVYLIADNLKDIQDVSGSIVHEVMGHFGLRGLIPKEQLIPILKQVADFYGADGLRDIADQYDLDLKKYGDRIRAAEEKLAFAQQEAVSEKERGFFKTIYAKIRQLLRKAGLVHTMTDNDISQLLLDARKFAQGKIERDSNPYPFGSSPVYQLSQTKRGKSLYKDVQERMDKAQGKTRDTLETQAKGWLEKIKHAARHFPLLDPKKWGNLTNYLRVYEEVPSFSKYVAEQEIRKFIKDLNPEEYDMFRMHIIQGDLLKDVNKGIYNEVLAAGEPLPFGYKDKAALEADADNIASQVANSEVTTKAIKARKKYMNTLKETLVAEKLLPQTVLNDDEYFHHQVLEYLNEKSGLGISSKDIRLKKKGFQKGRKGYTGDYNTQYVEAEFEIISHAISQLETKHLMDRLDKDHNIVGSLRADAREENIQRVYDAFKYDPGAPDNEPGSDPFFPFNQKMAIGFNRIGEMGSKGMIEVPLELEDTLGRIVHEYDVKKEQEGIDFIDQFQPNNEHLDEPGVFKLLSFLLNRGDDGAREAAMIFKSIQDRKKFITTVLGAKEVTWESLINSDTHTIWRPKPNTAWYMTNSINDRIIERVVQGERALQNEDVRKVLARGADVEWVIPKELAQTLDNFKNFQEDTAIGEISKKIMNTWKQWVLINPLRFFKYNVNNMSGDADITFAYAPEIIKKYAIPAFRDLIKDYRKQDIGEETSDEFREAVRQGVLNAGITTKEIPDITKAMEFEHAMKAILPKDNGKGLKVLKRGAKGTWFFLKDSTNLRENVLRLAAYRYFKDQIAAGNKPIGVSEFTKTSQIKDNNERAAMLGRELLGDYGNLSHTSEWLRQNLIPFWSWQAINAPRYFRLYQNLQHDERTGASVRGAATLAWKGGKTSLKVALLYAMINAWNAVFWPDEEEALGESGRRQLHLILGKRGDGHIISLRLQGALSDALGWFALEDLPSDVSDIAAGRATVGEKLKESLEAPIARIYQGSRPLLKSVVESGIGLSTYPSFSSPRPVRDKVEHFLRAFSLDKFWDLAAGKPKEHGSVMDQIMKDFTSVFFYDTDVDVTNYYDTRKKVFDFREKELGIPPETSIPSNKSTALYYYKQAFRLGDVKAAEKYLEKYFSLGGTVKGIHTSIRLIHPLGGLAKKYRAKFIRSLSPSEKSKYRRALTWYRETYTKRHPEFKGVVSRAWKKSREK